MTRRIDYARIAPAGVRAVMGVEQYVRQSTIDKRLLELVKLRASYMNGARVAETRAHFSDAELVNLTMAVIAINAWNRLAISLGADVGCYQPPSALASKTV